ncbi:Uncharacterised protein [Niallia circulans]|jgi:hypothetical protein|nr:Uncharacterised protein [Niallia circulans]
MIKTVLLLTILFFAFNAQTAFISTYENVNTSVKPGQAV